VIFKVILNVTLNNGCLLGCDVVYSGICYVLVSLSISDSIHVIYSLTREVVLLVFLIEYHLMKPYDGVEVSSTCS
jgi:hypothetical protein